MRLFAVERYFACAMSLALYALNGNSFLRCLLKGCLADMQGSLGLKKVFIGGKPLTTQE
jgi:hypothetical protein